MSNPLFSCLCITYGRHRNVGEVVADFLAQDYKGEKELIILNTFPQQTLCCASVRVINCGTRPASLGEARNMAIQAAAGTHIITWDDDDAFLPNHLSNYARAFDEKTHWVWLTPQFWGMGDKVQGVVPGACPTFAFTKEAWAKAGGYPPLTCGEDRGLLGKIAQSFPGKKVELPESEISFIYRWQNGTYHASGMGDDHPGQKTAFQRVAEDLQRRVKAGVEPLGEITLKVGRGVNWVTQTKNFLAGRSPQKKTEVCVVELGRYGDIVNILPICQRIHDTYATPKLMVSREFASLLDGVSYVEPYLVDLKNDQLNEAVKLAKHRFKYVLTTQIWGTGWAQVKETPGYNMESWRMGGFLHKFADRTWAPVFDRRDKGREEGVFKKCSSAGKSLLLVNVTAGTSSPFTRGPALLAAIKAKWGNDLEIVDLGSLRLHRVYDMLGLMEHALALVSIDTLPLHLAAACGIPTVALVNPNQWQGTIPRCNCIARMTYDDATPDVVNAAIEKAIHSEPVKFTPNPVCTPPAYRNIFHCVERHEEKDPKANARKEFAQASWDVLYSEHDVIPMHLWQYPRTAHEIGDHRALPYLKDVLEPALAVAADDDIIMWTNDDNWLHPEVASFLRYHIALYEVCTSRRCEFLGAIPTNRSPKDLDAMSRGHIGRDLFACTKRWLAERWEELPDFLLGASDFDLCLAAMVRKHFRLPFDRKNCEFNLFPADLPRGYVAHTAHASKWAAMGNHDSAPSQKWNRGKFKEWKDRHMPDLVLHPPHWVL